MKVPFDLHRQIPLVRRFLQERDKLLEEKDALASEVNALHMQLDVMGKNSVSMHSKIAELESELQRRPSELDSENLAKLAYEQLRTNYGAIERYLPRTTAAVFSRSQLQQELFVLEQLDFKRCGFFLEVGVGPGVEYSNTYLLERTFGWRGVLCEPNPHYADSIRAHRSVPLDTRAAYSSSDEKLRFYVCRETMVFCQRSQISRIRIDTSDGGMKLKSRLFH